MLLLRTKSCANVYLIVAENILQNSIRPTSRILDLLMGSPGTIQEGPYVVDTPVKILSMIRYKDLIFCRSDLLEVLLMPKNFTFWGFDPKFVGTSFRLQKAHSCAEEHVLSPRWSRS